MFKLTKQNHIIHRLNISIYYKYNATMLPLLNDESGDYKKFR